MIISPASCRSTSATSASYAARYSTSRLSTTLIGVSTVANGCRRSASRCVAGASLPWPVMPTAPTSPSSWARRAASSAPPRTGCEVQVGKVADRVQLQQVDMVGLQPFQRPVDRRPGALGVTVAGLGREEQVGAAGLEVRHQRPEPQLRIAVARRHVEVVDAGVERLLHRGVGGVLCHLAECGCTVDQDRALVLEPSQPSTFHQTSLVRRRWATARTVMTSMTARPAVASPSPT